MSRRPRALAGPLVVAALALSACGGESESESASRSPTAASPTTSPRSGASTRAPSAAVSRRARGRGGRGPLPPLHGDRRRRCRRRALRGGPKRPHRRADRRLRRGRPPHHQLRRAPARAISRSTPTASRCVMQMKQTQPAANGDGTPVLSLEAREGAGSSSRAPRRARARTRASCGPHRPRPAPGPASRSTRPTRADSEQRLGAGPRRPRRRRQARDRQRRDRRRTRSSARPRAGRRATGSRLARRSPRTCAWASITTRRSPARAPGAARSSSTTSRSSPRTRSRPPKNGKGPPEGALWFRRTYHRSFPRPARRSFKSLDCLIDSSLHNLNTGQSEKLQFVAEPIPRRGFPAFCGHPRTGPAPPRQVVARRPAHRQEYKHFLSEPDARLSGPRALSSVGRAPARQAGGHWFEPSSAHVTEAALRSGFCVLSVSRCPDRVRRSRRSGSRARGRSGRRRGSAAAAGRPPRARAGRQGRWRCRRAGGARRGPWCCRRARP